MKTLFLISLFSGSGLIEMPCPLVYGQVFCEQAWVESQTRGHIQQQLYYKKFLDRVKTPYQGQR